MSGICTATAEGYSKYGLDRIGELRFSAKTLIYFQLVYVLLVLFFKDTFGIPSSSLYLTDVITVLSLLCCKKGSWSRFRKLGNSFVLAVFVVFCIVLFIGDVAHEVKIPLVLWGIRNSFRFFVFLYACVSILDYRDIKKIINLFFAFQILNFLLTFVQFAQGFSGDHLGGIFGTVTGVNAYTNVFFCILLSYYAIAYVDGKESLFRLVFVALSTLIIAALAELKWFYFEVAIIIFFVAAKRSNKVKSFLMVLVTIFVFVLALQVFALVFPSAYGMLTNFDELLWYATDNSGAVAGYNISRLGAFGDINTFIFHDDLLLNLFGIGFGNAGYSAYAMFTSDFYYQYGNLNYHFFTHQNWFIETGYIGFGLLISLFGALFLYCGKWAKRIPNNSYLFSFVQLFILLTVLCFWYNQALRVEVAYLTFAVLAIPFIIVKTYLENQK